ncbi:MAG: DEAD/DEAH box helicase [bacterium]
MVYSNIDLIASDRTGSGKTLSYVLPLTERLRDQGFFGKRSKKPLIICVLPTRELSV